MLNKTLFLILSTFLLVKLALLVFASSELVIRIFDVGQGDAILIKTPQKTLILIDGGPDFEADRYIDKEFWLNGCRLDMLILTHPHRDHLKGLNRMIDRCRVEVILHSPVDYESREYERWMENLTGIKTLQVQAGDVVFDGDIRLVVVWPLASEDTQKNINNQSVSILLDYKNFEALFLGDLEKEASSKLDRKLLSQFIDGRLEVFKVPHHGSIDSFNPGLISFLDPKLCAVSVGENKFGHPHKKVLENMNEQGCIVQRTDEVGTIEVLVN